MTSSDQTRPCGPDEIDAAIELLVEAFVDDPTWSWIFHDLAQRRDLLRILWGAIVRGVSQYSTVLLNPDATAVAVWVPPDGVEIPEADEPAMVAALSDLLGDDVARVLDALDAFDAAHPHHEPHYSLSLLGTSVAHRGHGLGLGLLEASLELVDREGVSSYLEASNPVNVALYERYGFQRYGSFVIPHGGPTVATMWRPAQRPHRASGSNP